MSEKTLELAVEGMSCSHCVASVEKALDELEGVGRVKVDLQEKKVRVDYDSAAVELQSIREAIEGRGFKVAD